MSAPRSNPNTEVLCLALSQWCEALEALRITAAEDQPAPGESALADRLADDADEVIGWLSEATAGLERSDDYTEAHRLIARALRKQGDALFGCVRQAHLEQLARGPDGRWRAWVSVVRSALEPLWCRSEEVVTRLASPAQAPTPAPAPAPRPSTSASASVSASARRVNPGNLFQEHTTLNQSN